MRKLQQGKSEKYFPPNATGMLSKAMRTDVERAVLTVLRHEGGWVVEHDGSHFGHSSDKEVAKASAHKRAREMLSAGRGAQVRVYGEHRFFGA